MSLNDIIAQITNDYKTESQNLKNELKIQLEDKKSENNKILSDKKDELQKQNNKNSEATIKKAAANWILDWKGEVLKAKHEKIDELYSSSKWKIVKSWKESKDIYLKLLKTVSEDKWTIIYSKWNIWIIKEALADSWKTFSVDSEWEFKWWFKVITENSEYDFTLDSLMDRYKKSNDLNISKKLFS